MNFQGIFRNKIAIGVVAILVILAWLFFFKPFGKVDDWKYSYTPSDRYIIYGAVIAGLIVLAWLIYSIYLIVSGKPLIERGVQRPNPKRFVGIWSLMAPVVFILIAVIIFWLSTVSRIYILFLVVPILILVYLISGIKYAFKNKVHFAILPILTITIVILVGGFLFFSYFGVLNPQNLISYGASAEKLGYSVGGAKDINNFRHNINQSYLPLSTDITYEGLFYEYFFDTGEKQECTKLFCPSFSYAISQDPFSLEDQYYMAVGLNSGIKEQDFHRKKLNLVIVLDMSGSMSSPFTSYYYDQFGRSHLYEGAENDSDREKSKMQVATKSVVALLSHLNPEDSFGMVVYESNAYLAKPLRLIADTDMDKIKGHILEITPRGSTNFEAGYRMGTDLFKDYLNADPEEYENRIIFLTDAMPNTGDFSEAGLLGLTKKNSQEGIYTTFIGIGVDFNTELIEFITKIRGSNYYSVHSSAEFKNRMDNEFEYMVTPLVFNLTLVLEAPGFRIDKVYGSPEANESTGEIMRVNTLFPSKKEGAETKGGLILLKLRKISSQSDMKLKVTSEDRLGNVAGNEVVVYMQPMTPDYFENNGIRKGLLLSRYADLMKNWINDERVSYEEKQRIVPKVNSINGIAIPPDDVIDYQLSRWERQSVPLQVSDEYRGLFRQFKIYFEKEQQAIGDPTLSKEVDILSKLINYQR